MGIGIILDILLIAHRSCCYLLVALFQLPLLVHHAASPSVVNTLPSVHA